MLRRISLAALLLAITCTGLVATAFAAGSPQRKLSDSNNRQTVKVTKGTILTVTLHSTYWSFNGPSGGVLRALGTPKVALAPVGTCVPGGGCGTVTESYKAIKDGSGAINASRTTCGEALLCQPSQRTYVVHVTVAH